MKCPDCGNRLGEVMFSTEERAMRCFRCGGFFIDSNTANNLAAQKLNTWRRISVDPVWLKGGTGNCPLDNTPLTRYFGELIPSNVMAMRCVRCGKWWFPGVSLFNFKPALESRVNYMRLWGKPAEINKIGLPLFMMALLIAGLGVGVGLVRTRTQIGVPAATEQFRMQVIYLGQGKAEVVAAGAGKMELELTRRDGSGLVKFENKCDAGKCKIEISGLEIGQKYTIKIGKEQYFVMGR